MERELMYGECIHHENLASCRICNGTKEPDFEKMWKGIVERIEQPYFYFIEEKGTGLWLSGESSDPKVILTKDLQEAFSFKGKDAKEMALIYLVLEQDRGNLLNFIVTEHEFV